MNKSYFLAIFIAVIAVLWIGSGFLFQTDMAADGEENTALPLSVESNTAPEQMTVQVQTATPQPYIKKISSNGRSQASKNVVIRAEAEGQVLRILKEEGKPAVKGDHLIAIDVRERKERVREARELVKQRKIEYDAARKLRKQGYTSDVRLAQTQSALESARASLKRAEIDLEKTTISAPFDGVLGQRHVDIGDYVRVGDEIMTIVDLDPLEVDVFVNEKDVVQIQKGNKAILTFAGGENRMGQVTFVSPAADEETRTFLVHVEMDNADHKLPAGLTTQVEIEVKSKQAFQIKPSILTLDDTGAVGVKTVSADNMVVFTPIEIIEDTPTHLWVTGLQAGMKIVTVGQDFIIPGQKVTPVESEAGDKE